MTMELWRIEDQTGAGPYRARALPRKHPGVIGDDTDGRTPQQLRLFHHLVSELSHSQPPHAHPSMNDDFTSEQISAAGLDRVCAFTDLEAVKSWMDGANWDLFEAAGQQLIRCEAKESVVGGDGRQALCSNARLDRVEIIGFDVIGQRGPSL